MSQNFNLFPSVVFIPVLKVAFCFSRFSEVFHSVSMNIHDDIFYEDDIWPELEQNG